MSGKRRKQIVEAIKELGKAEKFEVYSGKVSAADEEATTCDVDIEEGLTVFDVRLRAVITDDTGVWVLPKVGSYVQIAQIEGGNQFVLISASEVDKVFVKIGDKTLEISADGFVFNGGNNDGLVKVNALVTKINTLENKLNLLLNTLNSWVPVPSDGGAALSVPFKALYLTTLAPIAPVTTANDLKNSAVKH